MHRPKAGPLVWDPTRPKFGQSNGKIFVLRWNKLSGSNLALIWRSRGRFSPHSSSDDETQDVAPTVVRVSREASLSRTREDASFTPAQK